MAPRTDDLTPVEREALAGIARRHFGFGSLDTHAGDDRDFREVARGSAAAALTAAFRLGRTVAAGRPSEDRAPDCATSRAAQVAGVLAEAVMAGEISLLDEATPDFARRLPALNDGDGLRDFTQGFRTACLMIEARARASVRTPDGAALSAAEAALALAEDGIDGDENGDTAEALVVLAFIRDTLRAGLARRHAAETAAQAPYDPGPPRIDDQDEPGPPGVVDRYAPGPAGT